MVWRLLYRWQPSKGWKFIHALLTFTRAEVESVCVEAHYLEQGLLEERAFTAAFDTTFVQARGRWAGMAHHGGGKMLPELPLLLASPDLAFFTAAANLTGQASADNCRQGAGRAAAAAARTHNSRPATSCGTNGRADGRAGLLG